MFPMYSVQCPDCGLLIGSEPECDLTEAEVPKHYRRTNLLVRNHAYTLGTNGSIGQHVSEREALESVLCTGTSKKGLLVNYSIPGILS